MRPTDKELERFVTNTGFSLDICRGQGPTVFRIIDDSGGTILSCWSEREVLAFLLGVIQAEDRGLRADQG